MAVNALVSEGGMLARRILTGLDVQPLLDQIADVGADLWNADPSWIPRHAAYAPDNIVLRYDDREMFSGRLQHRHWMEWDRPARRLLSAAAPIIVAVMAAVQGDVLGRVGITRMSAGDHLPLHTDARPGRIIFDRYQIPLSVGAGVRFIVADEVIPMLPGEAWWFDKTLPHSVINDSPAPRLAMVMEVHSC